MADETNAKVIDKIKKALLALHDDAESELYSRRNSEAAQKFDIEYSQGKYNAYDKALKDLEPLLSAAEEEIEQQQGKIRLLMSTLHYECPEKYPDNCVICKGTKGGVCGNENIIDGKVMCDYCHAEAMLKPKPENEE